MKALLYLLRKTIQNALRELVKKPMTLIPYLVIAGLLIFSATMTSGEPAGEVRNLNAYAAIVNGVFLLIFCTSLLQGLKQGMALFSMADVNLLFTAPVNPRKILIYGVVRQAGILVLASVCMLAQYPNLRMNCGLGGEAVAGLMIGYILVGVFCQLFSANLYALCAARPQWRKRVDAMLKGFMVLLAIGVVIFAMRGGDFVSALVHFFGSDAWNYVRRSASGGQSPCTQRLGNGALQWFMCCFPCFAAARWCFGSCAAMRIIMKMCSLRQSMLIM